MIRTCCGALSVTIVEEAASYSCCCTEQAEDESKNKAKIRMLLLILGIGAGATQLKTVFDSKLGTTYSGGPVTVPPPLPGKFVDPGPDPG